MGPPVEGTDMEFDHVGIATRDVDATADRLGALLGAPVVHEERFEGMEIVFLELDDGYFELLEPHEGGAIDTYLSRNGPGIHHFALATGDIEEALQRAREQDVRLIDERPRPGAWGHEVAFLHPESTDGVLIEFVQH
jgi:methylmalonyl-CoA/ethylmalonyl-CoA epimerase